MNAQPHTTRRGIEMDTKYSRANFLSADEASRESLREELQEQLTLRLKTAPDFHEGVQRIVEDLRALGYDLWSFDEEADYEVWTPNYANPTGPGIVVTFRPDDVEVDWSPQG